MVEAELSAVVRDLSAAFARRNVSYALIGGLAAGLRGRPRATKDADFLVNCPALELPGLLEDLAAQGFEIDVMDALRKWPTDKFFVFYRGQVRVDWLQPILPIYANVLQSAQTADWHGQPVRVATVEGLILTKMLAFRPQDQVDIETLLIGNRDTVDLSILRTEWSPYASIEPERTAWLEAAFARHVLPFTPGAVPPGADQS